ncbi:kelch-like protein diablo [Zeugodacus cucurbitae]|uniref:kelch-like protein diablo n=1 Tax=Zeugodacus cucurbitae TaxID=28588 RepID=UPI0023D8FECF|nr:kelch-like protein diablo [Zeugodacus cucurbitae]
MFTNFDDKGSKVNIPQRPFLFSSVKRRMHIPDEETTQTLSSDCTRNKVPRMDCNKNELHVTKLFEEIWKSYDEQDLIDVTFKVSNPPGLVPAHRLILSAASPHFRKLFHTEQGLSPVIEIHHIDGETFERLVGFCYTGTALLTRDNVEKMLKAAKLLKLDDMVAICIDFLIDHIRLFDMQWLYDLERETQCALLADRIKSYEVDNFNKISQNIDFLNFNAEKLQALVESNNLNVNSEEHALEAIERWYKHDVLARKKYLPALVACLRLTHFDVKFLLKRVKTLPGCELLTYKALSWISKPTLRKNIRLKFAEPREGLCGNWKSKALMAIQIDCEDTNHGYIYRFNKREDTWLEWDKIQINALNFEVIFVDDNLYFIGGKIDYEAIKTVNSWNIRTKAWKRLPDLNYARYWSSVTQLNGKIYVIGGLATDDKVSQSVEVYTDAGGWQEAANLITPRYGASAVTVNGNIYLMGGYGDGDLQSVERYNPLTNTWTSCAPLLTDHYLPGVAVYNRHIYVIGGWTQTPHAVVERYDVQSDKWTWVCTLTPGRWGAGCSFIDKQLWTVGGGSQTTYTSDVKVYDLSTNKWSDAKPLPRTGIYYCFTVSTPIMKIEKSENKEKNKEDK